MNRAASNLVLIASPRAAWVDSLKRWLEAAGMRGVRAGASLEGSLEEVNPRLVVVDTAGSPPEAIGICAAICLGSPDVPVLLIVAPGDSETVEQAAELGISHFAEEPITPKVLALAPQAALPDDRPRDGRPRPVWEVIAEERWPPSQRCIALWLQAHDEVSERGGKR